MSKWVLIVFLQYSYAGGVVTVEMPDERTCIRALRVASEMPTFADGTCLPRELEKQKP
jgi:hypothetical protein